MDDYSDRVVDFSEVGFDEVFFCADETTIFDNFNDLTVFGDNGFRFEKWSNSVGVWKKSVDRLAKSLAAVNSGGPDSFVNIYFEKPVDEFESVTFVLRYSKFRKNSSGFSCSIYFGSNAVKKDLAIRGSDLLADFSCFVWNFLKKKPNLGYSTNEISKLNNSEAIDMCDGEKNSLSELLLSNWPNWLIFLGDSYVQLLGEEKLSKAPIYLVKKLEHGCLLRFDQCPLSVRGFYNLESHPAAGRIVREYFTSIFEKTGEFK